MRGRIRVVGALVRREAAGAVDRSGYCFAPRTYLTTPEKTV